MVVANRLLLSDLDNPSLPTIYKMLHGGSVALVSPNCAGTKTETSVLLTANAGSPCLGGAFVKEFYQSWETVPDGTTAGEAYRVRTGHRGPRWSRGGVFLGLGQAIRQNAVNHQSFVHLGALGDALHKSCLITTITGNADRPPDVKDRAVAVLMMDSQGLVDTGAMQCGCFADLIAGDVIAHYFGCSVLLDEEKLAMSDSAYVAHKTEMLQDLDRGMDHLMTSQYMRNATFILVSFSPPIGTAWDQLTPIVVYPTKRPGLLMPSTTRTAGLVAASDFAPTVLSLMHIPASGDMIGRAAVVMPEVHAADRLREMSTRVTANQRALTPIAVFLVALGALTFTPTALIVAFGLKPSRRIVKLLKIGLVMGSTTFAALLLAVFAPAGIVGYISGTAVAMMLLTVVCLGLAALMGLRHKMVRALPVVLVYGATALIIIVDALTGCNLCKWSGPSSYQITGMRFYGIGNEYAGVLVSMAALAALFSLGRKWLVPVVGVVTIVTLGLGNLGANYGGTAAAVVTFGLLWMVVSRKGFGARHVVLVFGLAIAVVVGFAVLDWAIAGASGSHAARAAGLTEKLGGGYLGSIALRKVLFNLKITFSEQGLHYALAFVPFLALWFWKVQGRAREAFKSDTQLLAGMKAVLIGAAAAFLLNDSGIIFAGIMVAITVLVLLYSFLENKESCPES